MEVIKRLKESEKSVVSLVFEQETGTYYIEKVLTCPIEPYQKLQQITSPFLPNIFLVEERECRTYVLEEYINGRSLQGLKPTKHQENQWMREIFSALELLHKENLLHRDIKPSNLLLGEDGHIRLIDFDAVREETGEKDSDTRLLGTQGYAPPEQYGFSSTDVRADIYALGATMKEILQNRPSHRRIIHKCTNFSPNRRYSSLQKLKIAWKWRYVTFLFSLLAPFLLVPILLFFSWEKEGKIINEMDVLTMIHPLSSLEYMSYYASNEDTDSAFCFDDEVDFQGIHVEFQQIQDDFYATLYYTKQGEGWASLCYYEGDSLLPVVILEENSYEISFDQRGSGRLQEDYVSASFLRFTVNPLEELYFTLEENEIVSIDYMSLKSPDIWRDGEFLYYIMADSPYEDPLDGENQVHPFQIIKTFGQSLYQTWRNESDVVKLSPGDVHLLSCKPSILSGISFTYYEKDELNTIHTAVAPNFLNEILLNDVYYVKFTEYEW